MKTSKTMWSLLIRIGLLACVIIGTLFFVYVAEARPGSNLTVEDQQIFEAIADEMSGPTVSIEVDAGREQVKRYFYEEVMPRVPQAVNNLKAEPMCPGYCCPESMYELPSVTLKNNPDLHAAQIAQQLVGADYCEQ